MKKIKLTTSVVLSAALLLSPAYASAAPDKAPVNPKENVPTIANLNGNKLFDNLEEKLVEMEAQEKLPVIVQFEDSFQGKAVEALQKKIGNFELKHEYTIIHGIAGTMTKAQIEQMDKIPFIKQVEFDAPVQMTMNTADYSFGTEEARIDFGVDGDRDGNPNSYSKDDVTIAVIDTGIDTGHVDLDDGKVIGWHDIINGNSSPYDDQGHGTHCASIAAGDGDGNSAYAGVASGAALVGVKVLDQNGSGTMSGVTAGIDWAVQNKDTYGIDIISLSLGTSGSSDGTDSTSLAVNNANDAGIVVTVAAGNSGSNKYTIGSPGAAEKAVTVGAGADLGEGGFHLMNFSSRGPTADNRIKPDIWAPGSYINAAQQGTTRSYIEKSGTSMATPFTAGTVGLMLDANPSLTPAGVKSDLYGTAIEWGTSGKDIDFGHGRLDGCEAVKSAGAYSYGCDNLVVPNHFYRNDYLTGTGDSIIYEVNVTDTSFPIAATIINLGSENDGGPQDFDLYLLDSNNNELDRGYTLSRQETVSFEPTSSGIYKIKVKSYSGSGYFDLDISAGASSVTP